LLIFKHEAGNRLRGTADVFVVDDHPAAYPAILYRIEG